MNGSLRLGAVRGLPYKHVNSMMLLGFGGFNALASLYLMFAIRSMHSSFVTKGDCAC
jgi:hypothetical protein